MDFESPDVAKDFPGLYAAENMKRSQSRESDYSDDEKVSRKDLLGKRKDKKESKKDKGYVAFEGESSEDEMDETKSPGKIKKNRSTFKFPGKDKKDKLVKSKEKEVKDKKEDETKLSKKEFKDLKKESKKYKVKGKEEKKKKERSFKIKDKKKKSDQYSEERPVFGIPLHDTVERSKSHDGIEIPVVVRECIDYIEEHGLACEGIYRISGVKSKVRQLKSQYNRGDKVYLYEHEPHVVASLLKQFLRDLPEPILTNELMPKFEETSAMKNEPKKVEALLNLIESLPACNRLLLSWIIVHMLHVVKLEKRNKMNLQNVSIVLSPAMQISHRVLNALFTYSDVLFEGVEIKKYVPPIEPDSSRLSLELPDSPTAIEEELFKQENLLNVIHEELNSGLRNTEKEEQLWEVQRVVTQLKRKLRFLRQVQSASVPCVDDTKERNAVQKSECDKCDASTSGYTCSKTEITDEKESGLAEVPEDQSQNLSALSEPSVNNNGATKDTSGNEISQLPAGQVTFIEKDKISESECKNQVEETTIHVAESMQGTDREESDKSVPDKDIGYPQNFQPVDDDSDELIALRLEEMRLHIKEEELLLLGDELKRKINSEKQEIERLKQEISEYQMLYKYRPFSLDSTENSSSDSDESSASDGEENDAAHALKELLRKNALLQKMNQELSQKIQREREVCVDLKVSLKMVFEEPKFLEV